MVVKETVDREGDAWTMVIGCCIPANRRSYYNIPSIIHKKVHRRKTKLIIETIEFIYQLNFASTQKPCQKVLLLP
jgi:hypothetical protein